MSVSDPVVIVSAARTPLGRFQGDLSPNLKGTGARWNEEYANPQSDIRRRVAAMVANELMARLPRTPHEFEQFIERGYATGRHDGKPGALGVQRGHRRDRYAAAAQLVTQAQVMK